MEIESDCPQSQLHKGVDKRYRKENITSNEKRYVQ